MLDKLNRKIDYLRISVIDRCNLRCVYCMPEEGIESIPHDEILTYDEILRICEIVSELGIRKIKITGGEPLVRKDIVNLIRDIKNIDKIEQVTLTTNGILLHEMLDDLYDAGIDAINISLDTLNKDNFKKMTLGTSLMYWMGQENQTDQVIETLKAVQSQFPKLGKEDALLIMAHGTPDPSNAYYSVIQDRIHTLGMKNVFIYTVEGTPNLEQVIPQLKLHGIKHVTLMPFMMVAGDHANNDMAGAEPDSHKSILEKEGFKVDTYIHGLGENPNIRNLFVERANESWDALQK